MAIQINQGNVCYIKYVMMSYGIMTSNTHSRDCQNTPIISCIIWCNNINIDNWLLAFLFLIELSFYHLKCGIHFVALIITTTTAHYSHTIQILHYQSFSFIYSVIERLLSLIRSFYIQDHVKSLNPLSNKQFTSADF